MYRITVQPDHDNIQEEEVDVDTEEEQPIVPQTEGGSSVQRHQIIKETEEMIEINLSNEDEGQKIIFDKDSKDDSRTNFKRASINSNDQLVAATAAMANGASIVYISKVLIVHCPIYFVILFFREKVTFIYFNISYICVSD